MNPQLLNNPGIGLPQPGGDADQASAMQPPQTFQAPATITPQYAVPTTMPTNISPPLPSVAAYQPIAQPAPTAPQPAPTTRQAAPLSAAETLAKYNAPDVQAEIPDDVDTSFDEEWVLKAQEVVGHTQTDPFLQSQELGKLKAAYIKARYNKDIKVSL